MDNLNISTRHVGFTMFVMHNFTTHVCGQVMFSVMSVICLSVCLFIHNFHPFIFGMHVHFYYIYIKYEYQSHCSRSRSYEKTDNFTQIYSNMLTLYMWLQVINNVKITHQGKSKNVFLPTNFMLSILSMYSPFGIITSNQGCQVQVCGQVQMI